MSAVFGSTYVPVTTDVVTSSNQRCASTLRAKCRYELAAAAAGDGEFPAGLGLRTLEATRAVEAFEIEWHQGEIFCKDAEARQREAVQEGGAAALEYLADVLSEFVDEVLDLAPRLHALPDLETIAETNDKAALALRKRRPELIDKYLAIRNAQESVIMVTLTSASDFDGGRARVTRALLSVGQVRDAVNVEKPWTDTRKAAANASDSKMPAELLKWYTSTQKPVLSAVDWDGPLPKSDVDSQTAALLRIVEESTPWVPTADELDYVMRESECATGAMWRQSDSPRILASIAALAKVFDPDPTGSRW
ncbi:UNVERIFIED_ORG: hypothetical protein J3D58_000457 [Paenarthrobacter nicotinovorans]